VRLPPVSPARKAAAWTAAATLAIAPIAEHEGLRLVAYQDVAKVWTICYGETAGVRAGDRATKEYCDTRLAKSVQAHATRMQKCVVVDVPERSLVGLVSFGYNVGSGAFCRSTLVKKLNAGALAAACNELPKWVYAGGVKWRGLVNRRAWERGECLAGLDQSSPPGR
jgi:GH24 family phage-related lysozyme (muramidase)